MEKMMNSCDPTVEPETSADEKLPPKPRKYLFGRPVYTEEELREMEPFLPPEPHYKAEWERRKAQRKKN